MLCEVGGHGSQCTIRAAAVLAVLLALLFTVPGGATEQWSVKDVQALVRDSVSTEDAAGREACGAALNVLDWRAHDGLVAVLGSEAGPATKLRALEWLTIMYNRGPATPEHDKALEVVTGLIARYSGTEPTHRDLVRHAIWFIARWGDDSAGLVLERFATDRDNALNGCAAQALDTLAARQRWEVAATTWRQRKDPVAAEVHAWVRYLYDIDTHSDVDPLVSSFVAHELRSVGRRAYPALVAMLAEDHRNVWERGAIAIDLAYMPGNKTAAVEVALELYAQSDGPLRTGLEHLLMAAGGPEDWATARALKADSNVGLAYLDLEAAVAAWRDRHQHTLAERRDWVARLVHNCGPEQPRMPKTKLAWQELERLGPEAWPILAEIGVRHMQKDHNGPTRDRTAWYLLEHLPGHKPPALATARKVVATFIASPRHFRRPTAAEPVLDYLAADGTAEDLALLERGMASENPHVRIATHLAHERLAERLGQ